MQPSHERLTQEKVNAFLDEWGIKYDHELFFNDHESVSFDTQKGDTVVKVVVFKNELWAIPGNKLDQGLNIYSFADKCELAFALNKVGVHLPGDEDHHPRSKRTRCSCFGRPG